MLTILDTPKHRGKKGARRGVCASEDTHGDIGHHHSFALKNPVTPPLPIHLPPSPQQSPKNEALPGLATHGLCLTDERHHPGEGADSTVHLQTILLWPLHSLLPLPGDPTDLLGSSRRQNGAGSFSKKGQAMLPARWGGARRRSRVNIAIASVPWLQIRCKLQYCREVSTGLTVSMIIANM